MFTAQNVLDATPELEQELGNREENECNNMEWENDVQNKKIHTNNPNQRPTTSDPNQ